MNSSIFLLILPFVILVLLWHGFSGAWKKRRKPHAGIYGLIFLLLFPWFAWSYTNMTNSSPSPLCGRLSPDMRDSLAVKEWWQSIFPAYAHPKNWAYCFSSSSTLQEIEQQEYAKWNKQKIRQSKWAELDAHEKCPKHINIYQGSPDKKEEQEILYDFAYAHIDTIYLYMPPAANGWAGQVLTKEFMMNDMVSDQAWSVLSHDDAATHRRLVEDWAVRMERLYDAFNYEDMLHAAVDSIEQSIVYCSLKDGQTPKKVIIVESPFHSNLLQENSLTISLKVEFRVGSPPTSPSTSTFRDDIHVRAFQYSPNWDVLLDHLPQMRRNWNQPVYWYLAGKGWMMNSGRNISRLLTSASRTVTSGTWRKAPPNEDTRERIHGLIREALTKDIQLVLATPPLDRGG